MEVAINLERRKRTKRWGNKNIVCRVTNSSVIVEASKEERSDRREKEGGVSRVSVLTFMFFCSRDRLER